MSERQEGRKYGRMEPRKEEIKINYVKPQALETFC
jgi:hypothetical protein